MIRKQIGPRSGGTGAAPNSEVFHSQSNQTGCDPQPLAGERRKRRALTLLEQKRELLTLRARRALLTKLLETGEASADDVRAMVKMPPNVNPVCLGVVPGALARAGIIERVGFAGSKRADAHARPVSLWRLADSDAALAWLESHPEPVPESTSPSEAGQGLLFGAEGSL